MLNKKDPIKRPKTIHSSGTKRDAIEAHRARGQKMVIADDAINRAWHKGKHQPDANKIAKKAMDKEGVKQVNAIRKKNKFA